MKLNRIAIDSALYTGKPRIRGLRTPIWRLRGPLAAGETREAILKAYPYLPSEKLDQALAHAAYLVEKETLEMPR
jgi:uncharacterized protein (DUF433 family)